MKTKKKKTKVQRLKKQAEKLWEEVCLKRDSYECQVKKFFPHLDAHSPILQIDHFISRANKHLFLDPTNGTTVCKVCNSAKHWRPKGSIDQAIEEIVIMREGQETVDRMKELERSMKPNTDFSKSWWLEVEIKKLKRKL